MNFKKASPQTAKAPAMAVVQKKPGGSSHHGVPSLQHLAEPSNALDLQRTIGNQATIQLMQDRGVIQRMPTKQQLIDVAGKPRRNVGLIKMSQKYKAVLNALETYHQHSQRTVDSLGVLQYQEELLDEVQGACQTYVDAHKDEKTRTPHIQRILQVDVPADRAKLAFLIANYNTIKPKLLGKTVIEAMNLVSSMKNPTDLQGLMAFLQLDTTKALIRDQTKSASTQPFRGSDDLTLAGKSFTDVVGKDYLEKHLTPHVQTIIIELVNHLNSKKGAQPQPSGKQPSPSELLKSPDTIYSMSAIYEHLVRGLLLNTNGGAVVPKDILDAAAQIYRTVYSTVSSDPKAEHSADHAARVSVVNMIFLRFINPSVTKIASELKAKGGQGGSELIRLAQIFQSQVNGVDVLKKFSELGEAKDVVLRVQQAIDTIINSVIGQAQLLAGKDLTIGY